MRLSVVAPAGPLTDIVSVIKYRNKKQTAFYHEAHEEHEGKAYFSVLLRALRALRGLRGDIKQQCWRLTIYSPEQ